MFLMGALAALLISAVTAVHPKVVANTDLPGLDRSSLARVRQIMLSSGLILGPVTLWLILDN